MKESITQRVILSFIMDEEIRKIKCGADERRRRGLDRAEQLFASLLEANANESPQVHLKREFRSAGFRAFASLLEANANESPQVH